jgi:hypothetical protein
MFAIRPSFFMTDADGRSRKSPARRGITSFPLAMLNTPTLCVEALLPINLRRGPENLFEEIKNENH